MGRPTEEELAAALQEAARMREQGQDPNFVGKTLLNHNYRLTYLLQLYHQLEHYFHAGQADSEPYRAPLHVREQLVAGLKFPFIREATQSELRDYALEHKLFSPELTAYLTKDWGSW